MDILTERSIHELLAHTTSNWIVAVCGFDAWTCNEQKKVLQAAPWLRRRELLPGLLLDGRCVVLFDTETDARQFYSTLPTDDNPVGEVLFFAQLISPLDGLVSEST